MLDAGIDSIGLAFPSLYIEMEDLARARGIDPQKYIEGLGTKRMAVPPVDEDTVTLATRACQDALDAAGVPMSDIGMCIVGTETAVDHSKPVAAFVHGLLGLPPRCRVFETKHACYGGTAGLMFALDWVRSGSAAGKKALVVGSDIARYGLMTPGEPTQGAGAVALVVSAAPRLLHIDPFTGVYANDVFDFFRPLGSKDAVVDGHYSVTRYLSGLEAAYGAYREGHERTHGVPSDEFAAIAYHVPYPKMAKKAHAALRATEGDTNWQTSFERLVAPGLTFPAEIGNVYTASLYLALLSTLACAPKSLDGERLGLFSYGSGSCAEFFGGTVASGATGQVQRGAHAQRLANRTRIGIDAYEHIMRARIGIDERAFAPDSSGAGYLGVKDQRRMYQRASSSS
jgi:hydroxymethylglutaryl-CoA synthase